ncbi:MAG: cytochrome C biogenesis protein [Hydrogenophilales bacterium CG_4_9_14_3_um_filter_63_34]|nr:MAG: cytochrome C biogenesis protein [Hydrogenophilales bacterium CG_4_10_14_3_um_filter_63_21]PJB03239.1 MAG: cytochrome C biogenesis protein [Hydrogenophilales bacterium CG_4_9_14_3_um_filter_63_34]
MSDPILYTLCTLAYLGLATWFWPGQPGCFRTGWVPRLLPVIPLILHLYLLNVGVFEGQGIHLGFSTSISAIAALTVMTYVVASWRYHLAGLQGFVLAFAGIAVAIEAISPVPRAAVHSAMPAFQLHLAVAFAAYSLFTIAALHALLIALAEKDLHKAVPPKIVAGLPPLLTLEKLLFRMIEAGFVLLTLTLASGILFSEEIFGKPLPWNHKTVFGITSWLIFAALLLGRHIKGWRGRTAIRWTLAGFISLMFAYVGVKFVLEVLLGR